MDTSKETGEKRFQTPSEACDDNISQKAITTLTEGFQIEEILIWKRLPPTTEETVVFFKNTALLQHLDEGQFRILYEKERMYLNNPNGYKQGIWWLYRLDDKIKYFFKEWYLTTQEFIALFQVNAISLNQLLIGNPERIRKLFSSDNENPDFKKTLMNVRKDESKRLDLLGYVDPEYGEIYSDEEMQKLGLLE